MAHTAAVAELPYGRGVRLPDDPLISFDAVSNAAGLTSLSAWRFAAATLAGVIPVAYLITDFGKQLIELKHGFTVLIAVAWGGHARADRRDLAFTGDAFAERMTAVGPRRAMDLSGATSHGRCAAAVRSLPVVAGRPGVGRRPDASSW